MGAVALQWRVGKLSVTGEQWLGDMQRHPDVPRQFKSCTITGLCFFLQQSKPTRSGQSVEKQVTQLPSTLSTWFQKQLRK